MTTTQLFIPDIGTELTLAAVWEFPLYVETRNQPLAKKLGFPNCHQRSDNECWLSEEVYNALEESWGVYKKRLEKEFVNKEWWQIEDKDPIKMRFESEYKTEKAKIWKKYIGTNHVHKQSLSVTFPKDTILKVDRIYIRKGKGMSDYSSLTFYVKNGPYKGARFWAKLSDVNQIKIKLGS